MQKSLIFVFLSKEKLYLCNVFPWRHKSFYCSISHTNLHLERDITSKTKYTLELRTIAQSPTTVYLGQCKVRVRVWTGPALSLAHTDSASPLMRVKAIKSQHMSEYYYYGMAAVMLTTCWMFAAARWFHTWPAPRERKVQTTMIWNQHLLSAQFCQELCCCQKRQVAKLCKVSSVFTAQSIIHQDVRVEEYAFHRLNRALRRGALSISSSVNDAQPLHFRISDDAHTLQ